MADHLCELLERDGSPQPARDAVSRLLGLRNCPDELVHSIAAQLESRFSSGISQTKAITNQELKKEGFFVNLKQGALSSLAWTF